MAQSSVDDARATAEVLEDWGHVLHDARHLLGDPIAQPSDPTAAEVKAHARELLVHAAQAWSQMMSFLGDIAAEDTALSDEEARIVWEHATHG